MKLVKFAFAPSFAAMSVALCATLSSFAAPRPDSGLQILVR